MIEVNKSYDLLPGIDRQAYVAWSKGASATMLQAPGLVEMRVHRNLLGSPQVRSTSVWQSLAAWARFTESAEWQALELEFRTFLTNLEVQIWGPSPVMPEPLRPGK